MGNRLTTIGMGRKWGGAAVGDRSPLGPQDPIKQNVAWTEAYYHFTKWHLDPSNRLATTVGMPRSSALAYLHAKYHLDPSSRLATVNMGRKFGGLRPLFGGRGQRGPHLTKSRLGRGLPQYQVAS